LLLWIMSDIHLESTRGWDLPGPDERPRFDVLIVAGDLIPRMERGVAWLAERVTDKDKVVLYVAGNHEGYGCDIDRTVAKARAAAAGSRVIVMQDEVVTIGTTTFVAATFWTDFELFGDADRAMRVAGERMNDYKKIRQDMYRRKLRPLDTRARHFRSRALFEAEMRKPRSGPLVAISHHAPFPSAARAAMDGRDLSSDEILEAAYRSDQTRLMTPAPDEGSGALTPADLWVFGHTHESVDTKVRRATRVVSNAKGYGPWRVRETWDNPHFDVNFVIEI
jgi:predicted phosphodiesterase